MERNIKDNITGTKSFDEKEELVKLVYNYEFNC